MNIDWSKAPAGATHFNKAGGSNHRLYSWMQLVDGEWFFYRDQMWDIQHGKFPDDDDQLVKRPQTAWTGEGLPPVGTVCEYLGAHQYDKWSKVNIFAQWKDLVFVEFGYGWRQERDPSRFRPIRTPEQIAAEEREKTIAELKKVFDSISHELCQTSNKYLETLFGAIHDAGWKQVKP